MKRTVLILILALVCLPGIFADTVLLCLSESSPELEREDWPMSMMRAIEDGVLDVFFEEGHIVTNAFFDKDAGDSDPLMPPGNVSVTIADRIKKLADDHGAGIVIHLTICLPDEADDNLPLPEYFEYTLYRRGQDPLGPEIFELDVFHGETEASGLDFCTEAGRLLARRIASAL